MLHIVKFRSQLLSQFFSLRQISASIMEGDKENNSKSTIETSSSHDEVLPGKKTSSTSTEAPMMANVEKATGNVVTVNDGNSKKITQKPCSNAILVINNDKGEMLQTYWSIDRLTTKKQKKKNQNVRKESLKVVSHGRETKT